MSKRFRVTDSNLKSMGRSALISIGAIGFVVGLKLAFPMEDLSVLQTTVVTAVSGFVIASVYKISSNE